MLLAIALSGRVFTAVNTDILYDEFVYTYFIGDWFANHLWRYLFQLHHMFYPPLSPTFGHPPLGIWLMTPGISLAQSLGLDPLVGTRMVNIVLGLALCILIYYVGKSLFNEKVGLLAATLYALSPQAVAADSRAYLDTTISLFMLGSLFLFYLYASKKRHIYLILSSVVFGLAFLSGLNAIILAFIVPIVCLLLSRNLFRHFALSWRLPSYYAIAGFTAITLWAGFRDVAHVRNILNYWFTEKGPLNYPPLVSMELLLYQLSTVVVILLGIVLVVYVWRIIKGKMEEGHWFIAIPFLSILVFSALFTRSFHHIVPVMPYVFLLVAESVYFILNRTYWRPSYKNALTITWPRAVVISILLILQISAFLSMRPGYSGMYTNAFYNPYLQARGQIGSGQGMRDAAEWVRANVPEGWKINVLGSDWTLHYYLTNDSLDYREIHRGRDGKGIFWNDFPRSADWITVSDLNKSRNPTQVFQSYDVTIIHDSQLYRGSPYLSLYQMLQDRYGEPDLLVYSGYWHRVAVRGYIISNYLTGETGEGIKLVDTESKTGWVTKAIKGNEASISVDTSEYKEGDASLKVDYQLGIIDTWITIQHDLRVTWDLSTEALLRIWVYGDGSRNTLHIDLSDQKSNYSRWSTALYWEGWKLLTLMLDRPDRQIPTTPDMAKVKMLKIGIDGENLEPHTIRIDAIQLYGLR
ncbi:ArnT family glycosyltransferase [Chloroflexota bacterium]